MNSTLPEMNDSRQEWGPPPPRTPEVSRGEQSLDGFALDTSKAKSRVSSAHACLCKDSVPARVITPAPPPHDTSAANEAGQDTSLRLKYVFSMAYLSRMVYLIWLVLAFPLRRTSHLISRKTMNSMWLEEVSVTSIDVGILMVSGDRSEHTAYFILFVIYDFVRLR